MEWGPTEALEPGAQNNQGRKAGTSKHVSASDALLINNFPGYLLDLMKL
jgi:hypothetical protein